MGYRVLKGILTIAVIVYLIFSFIMGNLNPMESNMFVRFLEIIVFLSWTLLYCGSLKDDE
jgi:hypothetical protein